MEHILDDNWPVRLKKAGENLSRREKDLIDFITDKPYIAAFLKQNELCDQSGISKPIVISCFRKLGYEEYRDFQKGIRSFYASQIDSYQASSAAFKDLKDTKHLIETAMEIELRTLEKVKETAFGYLKELADSILSAETIYILAEGTGQYPGHYLWQRLRRCGLNSVLTGSDRNHWLDEMNKTGSKDIFLSFFYSREKDFLLHVLNFTGKRQCPSWVITGLMDHELAQSCNHLISVPRGQLSFKNSMAAPMTFAHLLLLAVEFQGGESLQNHLKELEDIRKELG